MNLFKSKARKRLNIWKYIREKRLGNFKEKQAIRKKLMEKYDIPETWKEMFYAGRDKEDDCYSFNDEDGHRIDLGVGDIIPFRRKGDLVFFYEITDSKTKYGDYGFSDYATFYDLKYHHAEKIPEKTVGSQKSNKIEWRKVDDEMQHGYVQDIRVVRLSVKVEKNEYSSYKYIEARYVNDNFSNTRHLPNYYDSYRTVTEAKTAIQKKVNDTIKDGGTIKQFYIPHKIRRKNR